MAIKAGIQLSVDSKGNLKVIDMVRGDVKRLNLETKKSRIELQKLNKQARSNSASMSSFARNVKLAGASLLAAFGVGNIGGEILRVGNTINGLNASLLATFGTTQEAANQLDFTRREANRLGIEFLTLAGNYHLWAAAANRTSLAGKETQEIFSAVSEATRVMNLSADDTSGVFRALNQILSKGKVQAEELRGQMGERIPGAFFLAAESMGMTTAELDKQLKVGNVYAEDFLPKFARKLREVYGGGLDAATANLQSNLNRITTGLQLLSLKTFREFEDSMNSASKALGDLLTNKTEEVFRVMEVAAVALTAAIATKLVPAILLFTRTSIIAFATNPILLMIGALTALGVALASHVNDLVTIENKTATVGDFVVATWINIKRVYNEVVGNLKTGWGLFTAVVDDDGPWVDVIGFMGALSDAAKIVGNGIVATFISSWDLIKFTWNVAPDFFRVIGLKIERSFTNAVNGVIQVFKTMGIAVASIMQGVLQSISEVMRSAGEKIALFDGEKGLAIVEASIDLRTKSYDLLTNAEQKAAEATKKHVSSVGDLDDKITTLTDKINIQKKALGKDLQENYEVDYLGNAYESASVAVTEFAKKVANTAESRMFMRETAEEIESMGGNMHDASFIMEDLDKKAKNVGVTLTNTGNAASKAGKKVSDLAKSKDKLKDALKSTLDDLEKERLQIGKNELQLYELTLRNNEYGKSKLKMSEADIAYRVQLKANNIAYKEQIKLEEEREKIRTDALNTRDEALEKMALERREMELGFKLIKGLTDEESRKFDLDQKAHELRLKTKETLKDINEELLYQKDLYNFGEVEAKRLDNLRDYKEKNGEIINQEEAKLRLQKAQTEAMEGLKDTLADAFRAGKFEWEVLKDSIKNFFLTDFNLNIKANIDKLFAGVQNVFSGKSGSVFSGGGLVSVFKTFTNDLFKVADGFKGVFQSFSIGSGLAGLLGGDQSSQLSAGLGSGIAQLFGASGPIGAAVGFIADAIFGDTEKYRATLGGSGVNNNKFEGKTYDGELGRLGIVQADFNNVGRDVIKKIEDAAGGLVTIGDQLASVLSESDVAAIKKRMETFSGDAKDFESFTVSYFKAIFENVPEAISQLVDLSAGAEEIASRIGSISEINKTAIPLLTELGFTLDKTNQQIIAEWGGGFDAFFAALGVTAEQAAEYTRESTEISIQTAVKWGDTLKKEGETAFDALMRSSQAFAAVNDSASNIKALNDVTDGLLSTDLAGLKAANTLVELAGGLDQFASKSQSFYDNFFTDQERLARSQDLATQAINEFEKAANRTFDTREGFADWVSSLDLMDSKQQELYISALDVADAYNLMLPAFADAESAIDDIGVTASTTVSGLAALNAELNTIAGQAPTAAAGATAFVGLLNEAELSTYILGNSTTSIQAWNVAHSDMQISSENARADYINLINTLRDSNDEALDDALKLAPVIRDRYIEEQRLIAEQEAANRAAEAARQAAITKERSILDQINTLAESISNKMTRLAELDARIAAGGTATTGIDLIREQIDAQNELTSGYRDTVSIQQTAYNEALRYWETQRDQAKSGRDYLNGLLLDNSLTQLTPQQQLAEAQAQFNAAIASGSISDSQSAMQSLLTLARQSNASTGAYDSIYNSSVSALDSLLSSIESQPAPSTDILDTAKAQLAAAEAQLALLQDNLEQAQRQATLDDLIAERGLLAAEIAQENAKKLALEQTLTGIDTNTAATNASVGIVGANTLSIDTNLGPGDTTPLGRIGKRLYGDAGYNGHHTAGTLLADNATLLSSILSNITSGGVTLGTLTATNKNQSKRSADNLKSLLQNAANVGVSSITPVFHAGADEIDAKLQTGERVLPRASNRVITEYFNQGGDKEVVNELRELRKENKAIRQEIYALRQERANDAGHAAGQRNQQIDTSKKTLKQTVRNKGLARVNT